jgi:hypothetical protein
MADIGIAPISPGRAVPNAAREPPDDAATFAHLAPPG